MLGFYDYPRIPKYNNVDIKNDKIFRLGSSRVNIYNTSN